MRRNRLVWITGILLAANFILGMQVQEKLAENESESLAKLDLVPEAMSLIRNNYVDAVDTEKLVYGALRGMLNSLDLHSQFLPPPAVKNIEVDTSGTFGGLGIEITKIRGFVTVVSAIVGTPAYRAGLMAGDKIVEIDGQRLTEETDLNDVVAKLRGEPGTKVTVLILRGPVTVKSITMTRAVIKVPSIVEARILEDSIGYVKVSQFQERTGSDLSQMLTDLESQGMSALILDLRDNPGGLLLSAVEVADLFLPGGHVIVSTKGRRPSQNQEFKSKEEGTHQMYPMAVLINTASASGSEIVAGAIKDLKRGILVGEKTYGKGTVQTILRLGKETALRLTTAKYYTPNGTSIQDTGIEPTFEVKLTVEQEEMRRTQKYKEIKEALEEEEEKKPRQGGETKKPSATKEGLEEPTAKEKKEQGFVDIQLQEAVRLLKFLRAIGADKVFTVPSGGASKPAPPNAG